MNTVDSNDLSRLAFRVTSRTTLRRLLVIRANYGEHGRDLDADVQLRASLASVVDTLVANAFHKIKHDERKQRLRNVRATAAKQLASPASEKALVFDRDTRVGTRLANALVDHDVETFEDLVARYSEEELLAWKNFGARTLRELKDILSEKGLKLRTRKEASS